MCRDACLLLYPGAVRPDASRRPTRHGAGCMVGAAILAESVGLAQLVVLDTLTPGGGSLSYYTTCRLSRSAHNQLPGGSRSVPWEFSRDACSAATPSRARLSKRLGDQLGHRQLKPGN